MSVHSEMMEIREYDKENIAKGIAFEDRVRILNTVFDEWVFTPNATWDNILATRTESVRCEQIEV